MQLHFDAGIVDGVVVATVTVEAIAMMTMTLEYMEEIYQQEMVEETEMVDSEGMEMEHDDNRVAEHWKLSILMRVYMAMIISLESWYKI